MAVFAIYKRGAREKQGVWLVLLQLLTSYSSATIHLPSDTSTLRLELRGTGVRQSAMEPVTFLLDNHTRKKS
jgi:hypothetical protein